MDHSEVEVVEDFGAGYFVPYQRALWDLFEKPQSSHCAKLISLLSIGLVLVSTVGMCLNTFPWMQVGIKYIIHIIQQTCFKAYLS